MANKSTIYIQDLNAYDSLYRFGELYPTFDIFKTDVSDYLLQIGVEDIEEQTYKILFAKYKNYFFKWDYRPDIHEEVAKWLDEYQTQKKILALDIQGTAGQTTTSTQININNELNNGTLEGQEYPDTKIVQEVSDRANIVQWELNRTDRNNTLRKLIEDFRFKFMNLKDETLERGQR